MAQGCIRTYAPLQVIQPARTAATKLGKNKKCRDGLDDGLRNKEDT